MTDDLLVPLPCHYALIRLNPTAMLGDLRLDDAITLAEAEKFKPKTYLAFLLWPEDLPLPGMRWCRYSVEPIGATLRTPIQEQGITSDMVIPIAPNDSHPRGRIPVHPSPSFPFANCFHWIESNVTVRIRVREDGFVHDRAVSLSAEEHVALMRRFEEDYERIGNFYAEQEAQLHHCSLDNPQNLKTQTTAASQVGGAQQFTQGVSDEHLSAAYLRYAREEGIDLGRGSSIDGAPASPTSASDDDFVDLFGRAPDPTTGLIPLVDAWMDIDQHLSADSIPSPDELENEVEEMIQ
ncbi:hypothetical protein K466DRAFT_540584 [Polyporus arcularius HHB13444]|uniref:Uncharacterized protein n=1 Tax=Polyporus arcularius HHB13444 TaxID=1314778 RepID=A0A5C3PQD9_9APHY|nr:hypothetical protein K466DRAFT_540584 [Polyporus arcularius HHB13444]